MDKIHVQWQDEPLIKAGIKSEGVKHDEGKLPEHLISPFAHNRLLKVLQFGAGKYAERNWEKGMAWSRVYAAAERHLHSWWKGETHDKETGFSHLAHALTCLHFLNHYESTRTGTDDRPLMIGND